MSDFDYIGLFIRSFRQANNESLQALSDRSGVSRSMIAQIESAQKSPTLAVLAKLATAMNIAIEDLVKAPGEAHNGEVLIPDDGNIVSKKGSAFVCHLLALKSVSNPADLYRFYFKKYGKTSFSANPISGSTKYLWVESGKLTIYFASKILQVSAGQAVKLAASVPHKFENRKGELVKGTFFVAYNS